MRLIVFFAMLLISVPMQGQSLRMSRFFASDCMEQYYLRQVQDRIISRELSGDTLELSIGFGAYCCLEFNGVASGKNDTLYLDILQNDGECMCYCYYEAHFFVMGPKSINIPVKFRGRGIELSTEKWMTFPPEFELFNGDTINYKDKYGMKQGRWFEGRDRKRYSVYKDGKGRAMGRILKRGRYEEDDFKVIRLYNKRGKILRETPPKQPSLHQVPSQ